MKALRVVALALVAIVCGESTETAAARLIAENRPTATGRSWWASTSGAALDASLISGAGTDDTAVLQRILDMAAGGRPVHLIIDGSALVSGLDIHGNTTIECTAGGGLYLKDNANRAIIRNAHRSRDAAQDQHIVIRGCTLNGNRGGQRIGDRSVPGGWYNPAESDGTFQSGLQFFGVEHLALERLSLRNVRSYGIWIANAKFVHLGNILVDTGLPPYPQGAPVVEQQAYHVKAASDDGIHLNGPIQYLTIDDLKVRSVDDAIALNANDHEVDDVTTANLMGPYVGQGPITDVVIRNVVFMDAHQGVRLLSRDQRIDRILFENLTGRVRQRVVMLSHFTNTKHVGDFGSIIFTNVAVEPIEGPPYLEVYPYIKDASAKDPSSWDVGEEADRPLFSLNSPIENLSLNHVVITPVDSRPLIRVGPDAVIRVLGIDMAIYDPTAQAVPIKLIGRVERLRASIDWPGKDAIRFEGGSIGHAHWMR
jgi:hypothetical protein